MQRAILFLVLTCLNLAAADFSKWQAQRQFGSDFLRHPDNIIALSFGPANRTLMSASQDGLIQVWDLERRSTLSALKIGTSLSQVRFSADGKTAVLLVDGENALAIWDLESGKEISRLTEFGSRISSLALSTDGKTIATGGMYDDPTVRIWDAKTKAKKHSFPLVKPVGHRCGIREMTFSKDGRVLLVADHSGGIAAWDLESGRRISALEEENAHETMIACSPDGTRWASTLMHTLAFFDVQSGRQLIRIADEKFSWRSLAFMPDGKHVLGLLNKELALFEIDTGAKKQSIAVPASGNSLMALSADGRLSATGGNDNFIRLWDLQTGKEIAPSPGHTAPVLDVQIAAGGANLISCADDETIRVWNTLDAAPLKTVDCSFNVARVALSPDGKEVFGTGSRKVSINGTDFFDTHAAVKSWAWATGKETRDIPSSDDGVWGHGKSLAFSPDGNVLIVGETSAVRLWDLKAEKEIRRIERTLSYHVTALSFSPNGKWILAGEGGTYTEAPEQMCLRVLDAETGEQLHAYEGEPESGWLGPVSGLRVSPDGQTFLVSLRSRARAPGDLMLFRFPRWTNVVRESDAAPHLAHLGDEKFEKREEATAALVALGPRARPFVEKLKGEKDVEISTRVSRILGAYADAFLPVVQGSLNDGCAIHGVEYHPAGRHWAAILETNSGEREIVFGELPEIGGELKIIHRIKAPRRAACLAFTPDGEALLTGNSDCTLTLYAGPKR